jgi:hypothetical protein
VKYELILFSIQQNGVNKNDINSAAQALWVWQSKYFVYPRAASIKSTAGCISRVMFSKQS